CAARLLSARGPSMHGLEPHSPGGPWTATPPATPGREAVPSQVVVVKEFTRTSEGRILRLSTPCRGRRGAAAARPQARGRPRGASRSVLRLEGDGLGGSEAEDDLTPDALRPFLVGRDDGDRGAGGPADDEPGLAVRADVAEQAGARAVVVRDGEGEGVRVPDLEAVGGSGLALDGDASAARRADEHEGGEE